MSPHIIVVRGSLAGRTFPLGDAPLSLGRNPDNDIVVSDPRASRRHAEIRRETAGFVLYDLGSSNGTLVNGQRIQSRALQPGDEFAIGDFAFRFDAPAVADGETLVVGSPMPPFVAPAEAPAGSAPPGQAPLPPMIGSPPPGRTPATGHQPRKPGLALLAVVGSLFVCIVLAGSIGGYMWWQSGRSSDDPITNPAPEATIVASSPSVTVVADPASELPDDAADWTVMVYLDGDNNLEPDALIDFMEMAEVGSSDQMHILVQLDRIASPERWDDADYGDWTGVKRFRVERGMQPTDANQIADLGELNMGDPETLADFLEWGITTYPARRYALVIWDHGAAWLGIASDDTSDGDAILLPELSAALNDAQQRTGIDKLDLIGFDACLMAQMDVLQTVAPFGQVAVASAEMEPNDGWAWDIWLDELARNPEQSARDIAPVIVSSYIDYYQDTGSDEVTLSAFDLSQSDQLISGLDALSNAMQKNLTGSFTAIGQARSFATFYAPLYAEDFSAVDLGDFARLLPEQGAHSEISSAARTLFDTIEQVRIAHGSGTYHPNSTGLSIYFPQVEELYYPIYERNSPLPNQTGWDEFLRDLHQTNDIALTRPTISDLSVSSTTVSTDAPVALSSTVAGQDIAYIFTFTGTPNASRDTVRLLNIDFVYPPGVAPTGDAPSWDTNGTQLRRDWDATSWHLTNGNETINILLGPVKYGTNIYGVEGVYTSRDTGQEIDAGLIFEIAQGQGILRRVWGFPKRAGKQDPQPFELSPQPGDTFTAYIRTYADEGDHLKPDVVAGETIVFGDQPLSAFLGPAPDGDYVTGFMVRDVSGQFSYQYADIRVSNAASPQQPTQEADSATPQVGDVEGMLAYTNRQLRFGIDYPEMWEPFDTGRDKIVFYNPANTDDTYFSIDVYKLAASPDAASLDMLNQFLDLLNDESGYEIQREIESFNVASRQGYEAELVYDNHAGRQIYVATVAVTSENTNLTYLLTIEAPIESFDRYLETFNTMLASFEIE